MMNEQDNNYHILKEWVSNQGVSLVGVADIKPLRKDFLQLPEQQVNSFDSAISLVARLSDAILAGIKTDQHSSIFITIVRPTFFLIA